MAYVISSIEMAPQPLYTAKAGASIDPEKSQASAGRNADFQAVLKESTLAAPAPVVSTPAIALLGLTTPAAPPATGTIGTIMLGAAGPIVNPTPSSPAMAPTAESLFGANPWVANAGGKGPYGSYSYNKYYFATPDTAAKVAQMLGGKVVATNDITPLGPFVQDQPNQMVQMPDGRMINAGIIASYFDHGWSQQTVDQLINGEIGSNPTIPT